MGVRHPGGSHRHRHRHRRFALLGRRLGDEGFVLLETLVAISLISVVMAGFTTFFINSVASTSAQRAAQTATEVANSAVENVRGLPASDLTKDRDLVVVQAQFTAARSNTAIASWLPATSMAEAFDPAAAGTGKGAAAAVPTIGFTVPKINGVDYTVNEYLGACEVLTLNAGCLLHDPASKVVGTQYLRLVVAVTWSGARCTQSVCTYLTSTLISAAADPLFNLSTSPPEIPVMTYPAAQIAAVNDVVKLRPTFTAFPRYRFSIAGVLPVGLSLNTSTGLISGMPLVVTPITTVTVTLTDGFDRTATAPVTLTVVPTLVGTAPQAQASLVGTAITALTVTASGGQTPYLWTVDAANPLPPGLSVSTVNNQAVITGTPNSVGPLPATFLVVLTVTDLVNRRATVPISWSISYPPFAAANPGLQKSTVGTALLAPLALTVTGGSGSFTWTGGGSLPAGLVMTTAGVITGTPTGPAGVISVTLTATDTKSSVSPGVFAFQTFTFNWTVFDRPTVVALAPAQVTFGASVVNLQLTTTCPNAPCTYTFNNGPATFAIGSTGLLNGTVTSVPQTFPGASFTVTDGSGATATSAPFSVVVNPLPTLSTPGDQLTAPGAAAAALNISNRLTGGTGAFTYSASANLPAWLTLNPSTGIITGTAPATSSVVSGIVVTVVDGYGKSASTPAFSWAVGAAPSPPQNVSVANGDGVLTVSWAPPANINGLPVTKYTVTLTAGGGSCATTGAVTCTISGLTNGIQYPVTVTATNGYGTSGPSAPVVGIPYPALLLATNPDLTLWLDGADPTVLFSGSGPGCTGPPATAGAALGCWKDKSGVHENFVQGTAVNQPSIGAWNALSAANFADSGRVINSIDDKDYYQTAFVAANITSVNTDGLIDLFGLATADTNVRIGPFPNFDRTKLNNNDWSYNTSSNNKPLNWSNGVQGGNINPPLGNVKPPLGLIITDQSATINASNRPGVPASPTPTFAASVSNTFNNRGIVGQIGDVITFKRGLSTAERRAVEEYLSNKWGVVIAPVPPPSAPLAVLPVAGDTTLTASWAVPASIGGAAGISYTAALSSGASCTTTALTCQFTGLTNGTSYSLTVKATTEYGTGPSSAPVSATPFPYPTVMAGASMSLWLDGSDPNARFSGSDCTTGGGSTTVIGCWKDKSSLHEDFIQATAANQPGVAPFNNNLNAANFVDASDVMTSINGNNQYQTVFVVSNVTSAGNGYSYLFGQANSDFSVRVGSNVNRTTPNGADWSSGTGTPPLNWTNGAQAVRRTMPATLITTDQSSGVKGPPFSASISNSALAGRGVVGQVGEVITFNRILDLVERRSVEEYLRVKWGVVITPGAPAPVTASRPTTTSAKVSWTAPPSNGGAGITTYTVTVAGQTFSTTNTTISFNGLSTTTLYTFKVTATNSAGIGPSGSSGPV